MKLFQSIALLSSTALLCCSPLTSNLWAQCESWEAYPDGVAKAQEQHVLYRDLFKAGKFEESFPYWEKVFQYVKAPKEAPSRHFSDGIKLYQEKMKKETDAAKKAEMLKIMVSLYDQMAQCTKENSTDRAYQGYYMYYFEADYAQTLKVLEKAMELGGNDVHEVVFVPISTIAVYLFQTKTPGIDADYMIKLYDKLKGITDHHVKSGSKNADKYKEKMTKVEEVFKPIGGQLWGCDYFVNQWKDAFEKDPNNFDQNTKILEILRPKCDKSNEFFAKVSAAWQPEKDKRDSIQTWDVDYLKMTSFQKAELHAKQAKREEKYGRTAEAEKHTDLADKFYEKAAEENDPQLTDDDKGMIYYKLAYKKYRAGNFSEARSLCRDASKYRPNWGEPYMLVGYMYAASGSRCDPSGKGAGWDAQVVVWAAMDEWARAKSVDPSVADDANKQIGKYRQYCPTAGDIFQRGHKEGDSYKVGCWIGVTTTIRAAN